MGTAMAQLSRTKVPAKPKTMFNVGVVAGGTSVNSIPTEVSMDVASESPDELNRLVEAFQRIVHSSIDEEKLNRSTTECRITAEVKLIGDRPGGETAVESPLISTTTAVLRAFGLTPTFRIGSTDSNIPITMGIPAVTNWARPWRPEPFT